MPTTLTFRADVLDAKAKAVGDDTLYEIAQRTGVRESTVSRAMAGLTIPTLPTLVAFATAYGTTLDDLVQRPTAGLGAGIPAQRSEAAA